MNTENTFTVPPLNSYTLAPARNWRIWPEPRSLTFAPALDNPLPDAADFADERLGRKWQCPNCVELRGKLAEARIGIQMTDLAAEGLRAKLTSGEAKLARALAEIQDLREQLERTDPGIHTCSDACQRPGCVMRRERDALLDWKESAMAVENEWDEQHIARLLGAHLGQSCRAIIAKRVPEIIAELATANAALNGSLHGEEAAPEWNAERHTDYCRRLAAGLPVTEAEADAGYEWAKSGKPLEEISR